MRCPKCRYISFDSGARCRNCGYDFSLVEAESAEVDDVLQITPEEEAGFVDFELSKESVALDTEGSFDLDPFGSRAPAGLGDLPLFRDPLSDISSDRPLIVAPSVPRPPLAVRKTTPEMNRARSRRSTPSRPEAPELRLDTPGVPEVRPDAPRVPETPMSIPGEAFPSGTVLVQTIAGLVRRATAGIIDLSIVVAIDATVLYLTLRICGLTFGEVGVLPPVPLVAFLLLLNGGYLWAFTAAGGQTIGKMIAGIRVVERGSVTVPPRTALLRTAAYLLSLLPVGLGFLVSLLDPERRTFHDRIVDTRVINI